MSETENTAGSMVFRRGFVYFIKPVDMDGPIKIGFTQDIDQRFAALQASSPVKLELAGYFAGNATHERELHCIFWEERSHYEWFRAVPELQAVVASYAGALEGDVAQAGYGQEPHAPAGKKSARQKEKYKGEVRLAKLARVERQRPFRGPAKKR